MGQLPPAFAGARWEDSMARGSEKRRERPKPGESGKRTLEGWRANTIDLKLGVEDLDLLDTVTAVVPLLRIVTAIGQEARRRGVTYPVSSARELQAHLKRVKLVFGNHLIDSEAVARTMPETWFPIVHEGELLSRVHLALVRCEAEAAQLAPRPVLLPK
jgi:hypothetical protein